MRDRLSSPVLRQDDLPNLLTQPGNQFELCIATQHPAAGSSRPAALAKRWLQDEHHLLPESEGGELRWSTPHGTAASTARKSTIAAQTRSNTTESDRATIDEASHGPISGHQLADALFEMLSSLTGQPPSVGLAPLADEVGRRLVQVRRLGGFHHLRHHASNLLNVLLVVLEIVLLDRESVK